MRIPVVSALICLAAFIVCAVAGVSGWYGFAAATVAHGPLAYGVFHAASSWVCPTIHRRKPEGDRTVALTFDDGPSPGVTPAVLRILEAHDVRATFFCIGRAVRRRPAIARAIVEAGHEVGNHSFHHPRHPYLWSKVTLLRDMRLAQRVIERATGSPPRYYRPPIGFRSFSMARAMRETPLTLVTFSARAFDTRCVTPPVIVERILRRVTPGGIILLHDGCDRKTNPDRTAMLAALPGLINRLRSMGYRFATLSELLETNGR